MKTSHMTAGDVALALAMREPVATKTADVKEVGEVVAQVVNTAQQHVRRIWVGSGEDFPDVVY